MKIRCGSLWRLKQGHCVYQHTPNPASFPTSCQSIIFHRNIDHFDIPWINSAFPNSAFPNSAMKRVNISLKGALLKSLSSIAPEIEGTLLYLDEVAAEAFGTSLGIQNLLGILPQHTWASSVVSIFNPLAINPSFSTSGQDSLTPFWFWCRFGCVQCVRPCNCSPSGCGHVRFERSFQSSSCRIHSTVSPRCARGHSSGLQGTGHKSHLKE